MPITNTKGVQLEMFRAQVGAVKSVADFTVVVGAERITKIATTTGAEIESNVANNADITVAPGSVSWTDLLSVTGPTVIQMINNSRHDLVQLQMAAAETAGDGIRCRIVWDGITTHDMYMVGAGALRTSYMFFPNYTSGSGTGGGFVSALCRVNSSFVIQGAKEGTIDQETTFIYTPDTYLYPGLY